MRSGLRLSGRGGQRGNTLIELVISVVIITIAVTGVLSVFVSTIGRSADAMREHQASAIAQAYLEEIQLHAFADPTQVETGGAEAGETRANFDDVQDFDGLSESPPRDQTGAALANLADYTVAVTIATTGTLGPGGLQTPAASTLLIDVLVTAGGGIATRMSGYRVAP